MLETIAWISLAVAFGCALWIAADEVRRPQRMMVMNIVWPVTALYLSVVGVWLYYRFGPGMRRDAPPMKMDEAEVEKPPTAGQAALAATHCGAGCTLADVVVDFSLFGLGATLLGSELYASYLWDFVAAWALGIVFQYFTIVPMRHLSPGQGILAAVKADTLSITAFQVGMYGWMALTWFVVFPAPRHLHPNMAGYWLMMQVAMVCGFLTSWPMNWLLIRMGWKEKMG